LRSFKRNLLLFCIFFLFINAATAQKQDTAFRCELAEEMPEFPGGQAALLKYIATNLKYPEGNIDDWQSCGRMVAKFVVNKSGKIEQVKIVRSCGIATYEKAIIELIQNMPLWKPGKTNGMAIDCNYTLPILIHLSE